jgi:hypothetical protein
LVLAETVAVVQEVMAAVLFSAQSLLLAEVEVAVVLGKMADQVVVVDMDQQKVL